MPLGRSLIELIGAAHDDLKDVVFCVDRERVIVYANDVARALARLGDDQLVGELCHTLFGHTAPCPGCRVHEVFESGIEADSAECACDNLAATTFERTWSPVRDSDGSVRYVVELVRPTPGLSSGAHVTCDTAERHHLDAAPAILLTLDALGRITLINKTGCDLLGVDRDDAIGRALFDDFVDPAEQSRCGFLFDALADSPGSSVVTCANTIVRPDGERRAIEWRAAPLEDDDGTFTGVVASGVDVSHRTHSVLDAALHSHILEQANDSVIVHTLEGEPVYANARAAALCGVTRDALLSFEPFGWLSEDARTLPDNVREALESAGAAKFETSYLRADGTTVPVEVNAVLIEVLGRPLVSTTGRDISERKRAEAAMSHLAFHDSLTGLANRALFLDRLRHAWSAKARTRERLAVAFIDLDGFKAINDTYGHRTGDAVLVAVSSHLAGSLRESDTLARLGGDEFTVLLEGVQSVRDAELIASKLLEAISAPIFVANTEIQLTGSIGIAIGTPAEDNDHMALLTHADTAMYRAKQSGRATYHVYSPATAHDRDEQRALSHSLSRALETNELSLHFQPIVRVDDGAITGVEALMRWTSPMHGTVPPSVFLPIAEESGLSAAIGAWVVETAASHFSGWRERGLGANARLALNLSARQLVTHEIVSSTIESLERHGIPGKLVEIEVAESALGTNGGAIRDALSSFAEHDIRVCLDDFGRGPLSLERILSLGIDTVKIDRQFVRGLGRDPESTALCRAAISMGGQLGITVVAEGVESRMQVACLRAERCPEMQGNLVSPALPAAAVEQLIAGESIDHWRAPPSHARRHVGAT